MALTISVTRLSDLLDFGQLFKAFGNKNLLKSPTFLGNFCKGVKIYHFSSEIIFRELLLTFGNFFWSHCSLSTHKILFDNDVIEAENAQRRRRTITVFQKQKISNSKN